MPSSWLLILALLVLAVGLLAWVVRAVEPQLAFFPTPGEDATPANYRVPFTPLTVTTTDGEHLRVWHLPRPDALAQVVYFHGNGGNLSLWCPVLVGLWHAGLDVVALDYRGYGLSTGRPSEQGLYRDIDATLTLVHETLRQREVRLVYWGRSLGATMAAYAATRRAPDGLLFEGGFPSMRAVLESNPLFWFLSWLSRYQFPTADWISTVHVPALVLHGTSDSVVPYRLGQRLYAAIPGPKRLVTIPGGDHNDLVPKDAELYWKAVASFVQSLD